MRSFRELSSLNGRVALVTGAAGHLGQVICRTLIELGCRVAAVDVRAEELETLCQNLDRRHPGAPLALPADLRDPGATQHLPQAVLNHWGRLDILVNNAAFVGTSRLPGWTVPFADQSVEAWRDCLEVNLTIPFLLSQSCAPLLAAHGSGSIVNISSIYGIVGPDLSLYDGTTMGNPAAYGVSKGGLLQLTRYLATVLAPSIRVNSICPGGIARSQVPAFVERYEKRTPLRRMAGEEDVIGALGYLAGDLSRYVTGQALVIDGGWSVW